MKELSIEEKAKRYDKAIERAKQLSKELTVDDIFEQIFPELKESKDEKIRKEMIFYFTEEIPQCSIQEHADKMREFISWLKRQEVERTKLELKAGNSYFCYKSRWERADSETFKKGLIYKCNKDGVLDNFVIKNPEQHFIEIKDERIAWLEKQGEQKFEQKFFINDKVVHKATGKVWTIHHYLKDTNSYYVEDNDGLLHHYTESELKLVEQKSADKAEPKFKVGDWVVYNRNDYSREIMQVYDIRDGRYYFNDNVHFSWSIKECDEKSHLWTIQDAKDGDVLANNGNIILFKQISDSARPDYKFIQSYCFVLTHSSDFYLSGTYNLDDGFHPATKEQRGLLFQKMKEAGYEWNAEKKELKKIEQKPAWSEEDENIICFLINVTENYRIRNGFSSVLEQGDKAIEWLKSLKDRVLPQPKPEWNEEDRLHYMNVLEALEYVKGCKSDYDKIEAAKSDIAWFKFLKDRVLPQPKPEWNEEDERNIKELLYLVEANYLSSEEPHDRLINFCESLSLRTAGSQVIGKQTNDF